MGVQSNNGLLFTCNLSLLILTANIFQRCRKGKYNPMFNIYKLYMYITQKIGGKVGIVFFELGAQVIT